MINENLPQWASGTITALRRPRVFQNQSYSLLRSIIVIFIQVESSYKVSTALELVSITHKSKPTNFFFFFCLRHSKYFRWVSRLFSVVGIWSSEALTPRQLLTTNSLFSKLEVSSLGSSKLAGRFQSICRSNRMAVPLPRRSGCSPNKRLRWYHLSGK